MKRQVQETGIRKWYGDDWTELQDELYKVLDGHFEQYGNMIIKGCEVAGSEIMPGIVALSGKDESNADIYKIAKFEGLQSVASWPVYLVLEKTEEKRLYNTGTNKNVAITYVATPQYSLPTGEYLTINQDGYNRTFRDALQSANYRFVTDAEKSTWNSKAPGVHGHAASQISQSSSYRFVTDAEKSTWNNARAGAVSDIRDGVATDKNTLKKFWDAISERLWSESNGVLSHDGNVTVHKSSSGIGKIFINGESGSARFCEISKSYDSPYEMTITSALSDYTGADIVFNSRLDKEVARIKADGKFGLLTPNPVDKLHIVPIAYGGGQDGGLRISDAGNNWVGRLAIKSTSGGLARLAIDWGNDEMISIRGGKVGIKTGESNPAYDFDVNGDGRFTGRLNSGDIHINQNGSPSLIFEQGDNRYRVYASMGPSVDYGFGWSDFDGNSYTKRLWLRNNKIGVNNDNPVYDFDVVGKGKFTGQLLASSFKTSGGNSSQFLKADGSLDSRAFLTAESDTLDSVAARGAITSKTLTVGDIIIQ